jgi:hypothetical protein
VDKCKPLSTGSADDMEDYVPLLSAAAVGRAHGRGLHSFTLQLNLSRF